MYLITLSIENFIGFLIKIFHNLYSDFNVALKASIILLDLIKYYGFKKTSLVLSHKKHNLDCLTSLTSSQSKKMLRNDLMAMMMMIIQIGG